MKKLTKKHKQIIEITIIVSICLISIFIWNSIIVYPIKLMTVLMHEISHGLSAILSGGNIVSLDISNDLSGNCIVNGGNSTLIALSGYLGSLIFGLLFIYSAYNKNAGKWILILTSSIIILITINTSKNSNLQIFSLLIVVSILIIYFYAPTLISKYILLIIGLISSLYVIVDIHNDIVDSKHLSSDAVILSNLTGINEFFWGISWLIIAIASLSFMIRYCYQKGFN